MLAKDFTTMYSSKNCTQPSQRLLQMNNADDVNS